jgi:hypothetical protein
MCIEDAHEHTGTDGTLRHSLRNGFKAYAAFSSATNSSCHRADGLPLINLGLGRWVSSGNSRRIDLSGLKGVLGH